MRYFLHIAYKGTNLHGWQKQDNAPTVQEKIEKGLSIILRSPITILGSGRTDAGVHATGQIAHFDWEKMNEEEASQLAYKLNSFLKNDIAVNWIKPVKEDAHARFDALLRTYHYELTTSKMPFAQEQISYYPALRKCEHFNLETLNRLSSNFLGKQDFQSFSRVKTEVNNFMCTITKAEWNQKENGVYIFTITANRFLRGMVRAIVGTVIDVLNDQIKEGELTDIIEARDRTKAGKAAKPHGLYLAEVTYPSEIYLPLE